MDIGPHAALLERCAIYRTLWNQQNRHMQTRRIRSCSSCPDPPPRRLVRTANDRLDPTLPAILEYQSPSTAIINLPMPRIARGFTLTLTSMIVVMTILAA